jgi:hypothetical protein
MANVVCYKSTQQGAPTLTGVAGSLITLLDACLVNGYGSVSVSSITQTGNVATVTTATAHGLLTGDRATIAGAAQTDYNVSATVAVTSATGFTYTVANNPVSPATGTITARRAGANWTKEFTGTNRAAYRMNPTNNTGFYLDVNDAAPGTGGAREARVLGFETMSAVGTGTGQFPTTAQLQSQFTNIRKSTTADATARAWTLVGDDSCFYLFTETGDVTLPVACCTFHFGDFISYRANDPYRCTLMARWVENQSGANGAFYTTGFSIQNGLLDPMGSGTGLGVVPNQLNTPLPGHFVARTFSGIGGSVTVAKQHDAFKAITTTGGAGTYFLGFGGMNNGNVAFPYPNATDGGLYSSPVWITHNNGVRGHLKGFWAPLHVLPLSHNDTFTGQGAMAGKTFLTQATMGTFTWNIGTPGEVFLETSNTWS